ncbi:D-aminoacyl-tRNA deacylase [Aestuariimicrobium ganziense]|uniref:D-aminoacyl-tRNA deacylase n=1 Tax=Aestuariimicrobium ganziense TaxID=2773677 RepID=UPI0019430F54|nr:D-aminoacyl-tRNA deacylase [Aestuariimicrobium ganziense]
MCRVVVQRASRGEVRVDDQVVGRLTAPGLVLLVGITHDDTPAVLDRVADKIWGLRILADEQSASDVGAPLLVVSQFTLYADVRKGRRPSWSKAAPGPVSEPLFEHFVDRLRQLGAHVETGVFGAMMQVDLVNDGPVTVLVDSDDLAAPRG